MENINNILEREIISNDIKKILLSFDENCKNIAFKRGIYIYGSPGCGKTQFVVDLLKELDYDIIKYDAGDVRNKALIDTITSNNVSNRNVLQMMTRKVKKLAIVMDEIDGMNNGDKGGITALIKIIRQKKTKKQRLESITMNPIICIGNYYIDKKIKELMKVCNTFELKTPVPNQMKQVLYNIIPTIKDKSNNYQSTILNYIQGDMRKLMFVKDIFSNIKREDLLTEDKIQQIFCNKSFNEDSKKITQSLINQPAKLEQHNKYMNETDFSNERFDAVMAAGWIRDLESSDSRIHKEKTIEKALMAAKLGSADAQCFLFNCYQAYNPFYTFNIRQGC